MNFSKLSDSNQIFRNDFICIHYDLCKISTQNIQFNFFAPRELAITTAIFKLPSVTRCQPLLVPVVSDGPGNPESSGTVAHVMLLQLFLVGHWINVTD